MKKKTLFLIPLCLLLVGCQTSGSDSQVTGPRDVSSETKNSTVTPSSPLPEVSSNPVSSDPILSSDKPEESVSSSSSSCDEVKVITSVDCSDLPMGTMAEDLVYNSVFTFLNGCQVDSNSKTVEVNGVSHAVTQRLKTTGSGDETKKSIKIHATTAGTLYFSVMSSSSTGTGRKWQLAKQGETTATAICPDDGVPTSTPSTYEVSIPALGDYFLYSLNSGINFYYFEFVQFTDLGTETGFEINTASVKTDYLIGESLSLDGLLADAIYSSGARMGIENKDLTIDSSKVDMNKAGSYEISVSYKGYEARKFSVTVHAVTGISEYHQFTQIASGYKANSILRTPEVYKINDVISKDNIVVKAIRDDKEEVTIDNPTITLPDTSTAGEKKISISYTHDNKTYSKEIPILVVDSTGFTIDTNGNLNVKVDSSVTTEGNVSGTYTFKTIQHAHDFVKTSKADTFPGKINIDVASGTYEEKVYIEMPNVNLIGKKDENGKNTVLIQYGLVAKDEDSKGNAWSTYGASSVSVSSEAGDFSATNIDFRNDAFTSMAEYKADTGSIQAPAFVSDSNCVMTECGFYGYQDTLYARVGNQLYQDCYVEGMTDFVFGEDSDVILSGGEIHLLNRDSATNGGYISAPKTPATRSIGFVFKDLKVTAEEGVTDATVSLARPWGKDARVSYLNCVLPAAISKGANPSSDGKNPRWSDMSGNKAANAHFSEYSNTGDGAITSAVAGGSILTETEYNTLLRLIKTAFPTLK